MGDVRPQAEPKWKAERRLLVSLLLETFPTPEVGRGGTSRSTRGRRRPARHPVSQSGIPLGESVVPVRVKDAEGNYLRTDHRRFRETDEQSMATSLYFDPMPSTPSHDAPGGQDRLVVYPRYGETRFSVTGADLKHGPDPNREHLFRHGSYSELERALAVMAHDAPNLRQLVGPLGEASQRSRDALEWLSREMKGPIRVPHWLRPRRSRD